MVSSDEDRESDELDVQSAARLVGRTPETVRRWVWSGRLSARREGRKLIVSRVDVVNLVGGVDVEIGDLEAWHAAVMKRAWAAREAGRSSGSAAELVIADRWERDELGSGPEGVDAGR